MSAAVYIYQKSFAVMAADTRHGLSLDVNSHGDELFSCIDGASKIYDAGDGAVVFRTNDFRGKGRDAVLKALRKPLRGTTAAEKAKHLHRIMRANGVEKNSCIILRFGDGPELAVAEPTGAKEYPNMEGEIITVGINDFVERLWNTVYVKDGGSYREMSPMKIKAANFTPSKAVDAALFLLQAGGRYMELCRFGSGKDIPLRRGESRRHMPTVGGATDLVLLLKQSGGGVRREYFQFGGKYGLDDDYFRLAQTLESIEDGSHV